METKKVLTAAEQLAAKKAAFEAAKVAYEAAQTELGLLATKEVICNAVNDCVDMDAICVALFSAIKENFPAKVSTFATLQEVFPVLMNVTVKKVKAGTKATSSSTDSSSKITKKSVLEGLLKNGCTMTEAETAIKTGWPNASGIARTVKFYFAELGAKEVNGKFTIV